jgi:hypothetical protein
VKTLNLFSKPATGVSASKGSNCASSSSVLVGGFMPMDAAAMGSPNRPVKPSRSTGKQEDGADQEYGSGDPLQVLELLARQIPMKSDKFQSA